MHRATTVADYLRARGVTRREFLRHCAYMASVMMLPVGMAPRIAAALERARRPSVIWLPFQECTGCTESITRSHDATIEGMIFDAISLDYQHTLQAAAGTAAERAREQAMKDNWGRYLLIVDGSVPTADAGYGTIAGVSHLEMLREAAKGAAAVVAVGTCAAFGGIPMAQPNPTGAVAVSEVVKDKPIINISGCPPIPVVITGVLMQYLTFGRLPELDALNRPRAFYGQTIHDRCYRRPFYERGQFAETFDDEGARKGWCLYKLGCKGPTTYNACATVKWNNGVGFPIEAGHGCIGCAEPRFWDQGGFYQALSTGRWGSARTVGTAVGVGVALGAAAAVAARRRQKELEEKP
jgi:hydrogenase small subunit